MTHTNVESYLVTLLAENWTESIDGRSNDVPKPKITGEDDDAQETLRTRDLVEVTPGRTIRDWQGIGGFERRREVPATIVARTAERRVDGLPIDPEVRLKGARDANNEPERWGGLVGEILRILESVRYGEHELDMVNGFEWEDTSNLAGKGNYRADIEVRLTRVAQVIDPSPTQP